MNAILVRSGGYVTDHEANEWRPMVRSFKLASRETCIVLSLESRDLCIIIDRYYVQPVDVYGSQKDHTSVLLHAMSCACHCAKHLESLEDWQLSAHIVNKETAYRGNRTTI